MNILVTGARGFIGQNLVTALRGNPNTSVIEAVRSAVDDDRSRYFDLSQTESWDINLLKGIDVVVHLAACVHQKVKNTDSIKLLNTTNIDGSRELIDRCLQAGVKRFVFLSSIGVHGQISTADAIHENSPLAPNSPYAESKLTIENYLKSPSIARLLESVVVRPPLVYGKTAPGNLSLLNKLVCSGIPLPFAGVNNKKSFISVENLVEVLQLCIFQPKAANETFTVADDECLSTENIIRQLAGASNSKVRLFPFPLPIIRWGLALIGQKRIYSQLFESLTINNTKTKLLLNWRPRACSLGAAAQRSIAPPK